MFFILLLTSLIFVLILIYLVFNIRMKLENNRKKIKFLLFNNRLSRIYSFENLSENILQDILEALKELNNTYEQVHAILPLLTDVRKHGERLLQQRRFYHTLFFPDSEQRLANKTRRLHQVENFIKSFSIRNQGADQFLTSDLRKAR